MDTQIIRFPFRGTAHNAVVHPHETHISVWFTDSEVILDFGGKITYNPDFSILDARQTKATDIKDFHGAIIEELRKLK